MGVFSRKAQQGRRNYQSALVGEAQPRVLADAILKPDEPEPRGIKSPASGKLTDKECGRLARFPSH